MSGRFHTIFKRAAVCTLLTFSATLAHAQAATAFDMPAQPLADSLKALASQTNTNVLFDRKLVERLRAPALKGELTTREAIARLLAGTGVTHEFVNEHTVVLASPRDKNSRTKEKTSDGRVSDGAFLSADESANAAMIKLALMNADEADKEAGDKSAGKKTAAGGNGDTVEEMLVEGKREKPIPFTTSNLDLTRTEDDALPFTVFTARDIEVSGTNSLQEFLSNKLPQNFSEVVMSEVAGVGSSQVNRVSMRGWDASETVFLLNGRRLAPQYVGSDGDGNNATPNLQGIPLRSIERIEILTSAGSAIYGANATGGVINIITRTDFKGGQFNVNYSTPADVHVPTRGAEATYAFPLGWQSNLRLLASFNESQPLQVGDRSEQTVERWRSMVLAREPGRLLSRTASPPIGATPNIRSSATDAAANLFGAGTPNYTTVPDGYAGGGGRSAFTPGVYNLQLTEVGGERNTFSKSGYLGSESSNIVFGLGLDKSFAQNWRWSIDYRYSQNNFDSGSNSTSVSVTVPAAAPSNPFGQNVSVRFVDPNLSRPELDGYMKNITWDVSTTLRGRVGSWTGFWDFGYTHNGNSSFSSSFSSPRGGWANAVLVGAYNPFVDMRVVAPAPASFYDDYVVSRFDFVSSNSQYLSGLKASGPLFTLPAGAVQLTAGLEWNHIGRGESFYFTRSYEALTGNLVGTYQYARRTGNRFDFDTQSVYAEMSLPLFAGKPLVNKLELTASGRLDRRLVDGMRDDAVSNHVNTLEDQFRGTPFKDATQANVYALAMRYDMVEGIGFRASQSIGFKPPSLWALTPPTPNATNATQVFSDPRRPNGTAPSTVVLDYTQFITGGNSSLIPETTNSRNFGFIVSPARVPGMRMSIDYVQSNRRDVISGLWAQLAVDLEADFPGRVVRGAPDGHPSGVGPVVFLDLRNVNLSQIVSKSIDINFDQRFQNVFGGRLGLTLAATRNLSFKVQSTSNSAPEEQVRNIFSTFSQQIAWNGNGQLSWEGKQWGFGWSARYYDYLLAYTNDRLLQGSDRAPWKINHDAFVSYRAGSADSGRGWQRVLSGTAITFGVRNVFDRAPRFWAASTDRGVAPYDSIMGRSVWLQMRKDFQ